MFEFSHQTGEVRAKQMGFAGGVIRFTFDRCTCVSDQLVWEHRDGCAITTFDGLEMYVCTDQRCLSAGVRNTGKRSIRLVDVAILFHPNRLPQVLAAEDYMELVQGPTFVGAGAASAWAWPIAGRGRTRQAAWFTCCNTAKRAGRFCFQRCRRMRAIL